jgi:DnaJ-class molecular chaperone
MKPNTADGRLSDWYASASGTRCPTCGGSGSKVNARREHVDACPTCRGFGKVDGNSND